jgi:glutamine amidotransferase
LEAQLSDELYLARRGTTDSELIFLTLLQNGLDQDCEGAWEKTIQMLQPAAGDKPVRITSVFSNGESLFAYRSASDGKCPTLYVSEECGGQTLASEPLCGDVKKWRAVPTNRVFRLNFPEVALA